MAKKGALADRMRAGGRGPRGVVGFSSPPAVTLWDWGYFGYPFGLALRPELRKGG